MSNDNCPTRDELTAFAIGQLASQLTDEIAIHIDQCPQCQDLLAIHDRCEDELLVHLGQLSESHFVSSTDVAAASPMSLSDQDTEPSSKAFVDDPGQVLSDQLAQGSCQLNKFVLESKLGAGSFGHVFRARDTELDRNVCHQDSTFQSNLVVRRQTAVSA